MEQLPNLLEQKGIHVNIDGKDLWTDHTEYGIDIWTNNGGTNSRARIDSSMFALVISEIKNRAGKDLENATQRNVAKESLYNATGDVQLYRLLILENVMLSVQTIEEAIEQLPKADLVRFRDWFLEFDSRIWDKQIEEDANAGKLDSLAAEALAEYHSGKATEL